MRKYTIPFVDLSVGDVCLPPNHPEAVRTPTGDICDRFRRFEFDEQVRERLRESRVSRNLGLTCTG